MLSCSDAQLDQDQMVKFANQEGNTEGNFQKLRMYHLFIDESPT